MKKLFFFFAAACMMVACNDAKTGYTIKGQMDTDTLHLDTVYLVKRIAGEDVRVDTAIIKDCAFSFEGVADSTELAYISIGVKGAGYATAPFFLENGDITFDINTAERKWSFTGTPCNDAYAAFRNAEDSLMAELTAVYNGLKVPELTEEERAAINVKLDSFAVLVKENIWTHLEKNIETPVGYYMVGLYGQRFLSDRAEKLGVLMERLPAQYANDYFVVRMKELIETMQKTAIGQKYTDFEMQTPEGKTVKLSDFVGKSKVLFVDFWASWCGPCRISIPELKQIYAEYQPLGLEILGVSFDNDAEAWKKAIKEEGLKWAQLSDLKGWDCVAGKIYGINSIPAFMVIDGEGTIISRERDFAKLRQQLDEILKK